MEIEQVIEEVLNNYNAYEKIIDVYYTDIYQYVLKIDGEKANGERVGVEMATDSAGYAAGRS